MNSDIIIIGSGPGGYRAAQYAAQHGLSVVIIEREHVGGTCLNVGCIPTKTYVRNAEVMQSLKDADEFGLHNLSYDFDFSKVVERKNAVVDKLRQGIDMLLSAPGITFVRGKARFKDAKTVVVKGCADGACSDMGADSDVEEYTATNIIIATGSNAKLPPIKDMDADMVCTSDWLLSTTELPKRLCIVGAGVIGMEFACVMNAFGVDVTVIEFLKECLPMLDSDIAKRLRKVLEKRGVKFYLQSGVTSISGGVVSFEKKGKQDSVEADKVLLAVGRKPNVEGLNIEAAGIEATAKGITVGDDMQTNVPGVYAIGDVNGRQMLAHAATMQGLHAVNNILGKPDNIDFSIMPAAIFTLPEAASVGVSEDWVKENAAQEKASDVSGVTSLLPNGKTIVASECRVGKVNYRSNGKALAMNEAEGMIKLIASKDGQILGCHAYGVHSADIIQEAAALMAAGTTVDQLKDIVHTHPTIGEMLQEAAEGM